MKVILFTHTKAPFLARTQVTEVIWWFLECLGYKVESYSQLPRTPQGKPYFALPISQVNQNLVNTKNIGSNKLAKTLAKISLVDISQFITELTEKYRLNLEQFLEIISTSEEQSIPNPENQKLHSFKKFTSTYLTNNCNLDHFDSELQLLDFSLSHSENLYACAVLFASPISTTKSEISVKPRIGCDIEQLNKIRLNVLAKVTNTRDEFRELNNKELSKSAPTLMDLLEWTQREAIIKSFSSSIFYAVRFNRDHEGNFYLNNFFAKYEPELLISLNSRLKTKNTLLPLIQIGSCLSLLVPQKQQAEASTKTSWFALSVQLPSQLDLKLELANFRLESKHLYSLNKIANLTPEILSSDSSIITSTNIYLKP